MKPQKRNFALGLITILLTACQTESEKAGPGSTSPEASGKISPTENIISDVIYGHKDGMALVYDVIRPAEPSGAAIVYMVSGGWYSYWQPATQRTKRLAPLLDAGFTVIPVHHGSAPKFLVPDAVSDVRAAVRHIKAHAVEYQIDPDRLGLFGGSAGGHLSLITGLAPEVAPDYKISGRWNSKLNNYHIEPDASASVAAVVAYYPPTDLRGWTGPNDRFPALNFPADQAAAISPILFVTDDDPPIKLIHGTQDEVVPLSQSQNLAAELENVGVIHDLLIIEGGDHGFRNQDHRNQATRAMVAWFKQHLIKD